MQFIATYRRSWQIILIPLVLSCLTDPALFAQEPAYKRFTEEDGLPSDKVYGLMVDQEGLIWITTDKGVSRFDGIVFKNYDLRSGLPDNEVFSAFQDKSGRIWFASYNGKPSYWHNGIIFNDRTDLELANMKVENYISAMAEDSAGNVFLGTRDGRLHIVRRNGKVELFHHEVPSSMAALGVKKDGSVEVATSTCEVLSIRKGKAIYHRLNPEIHPKRGRISEVMVSTMLLSGHFIYALGGRISVISPSYTPIIYPETPLTADTAAVLKVRELGEGRIFLCSSNGAYLFRSLDFGSGSFEHFLPGISISDVAEDNEGGWWFASSQGLFYASEPQIRRFNPDGFEGDEAFTSMIKLSEERFLLGQGNGSIMELDVNHSTISNYQVPNVGGYGMVANEIISIDSEYCWLASDKYLGIIQQNKKKVFPVFWDRAIDIARDDPSQTICICYAFGWSTVSESSILSGLGSTEGRMLAKPGSTNRCHAAEFDATHVLWVATNTHLLRIFKKDTIRIPLTSSESGAIRITELKADSQGGVWIGTAGHGILWVKGDKKVHFYDHETSGLNHINKITVLKAGLLGVGSDFGVSTISYDSTGIPVISPPIGRLDGLPSGRVFSMIYTDRCLWVSTEKGLCQIPLKLVNERREFPSVKIDQIVMGHQPLPLDSGQLLPYNGGVMKISFAGICLQSLGQFTYRYRINGLHSDWQFTRSTQIELPLLDPGEYTFQVDAKNHQGNWSTKPAMFHFTVSTPYWKSLWFQLGLPIVIILSISYIFVRLYNQEKNRNRLVSQLRDAEQRALIGQMNPHFIFNSLNSIQFFFLNQDFAKANDFLADFGELIRSILNHSRIPRIRLTDELSQLELYLKLEAARMNGKFEYKINLSLSLNSDKILIPTMLIQPFVENAIWHGIGPLENQMGQLTITLSASGTTLVCEIRDNGIGRKKSMELHQKSQRKHKSQAMEIVSERISLINRGKSLSIDVSFIDLMDNRGEGAGTLAILTFHFLQWQ